MISRMTQVAACPQCRRAIDAAQSESWCLGCGTPLGEEITSQLPKLVALRAAADRELAQRPPLTISRGERMFRGMLGMGTVFGLVGAALIGALSLVTLVVGGGQIDFDDDLDFMIVAPFAAFGIAFALGMLYAGLLALLARGRSFSELSIARVAAVGAAIGLVPAAVAIVGGTLSGAINVWDDALNAVLLFPPLSATVATITLLIARKAKPEAISEPHDQES